MQNSLFTKRSSNQDIIWEGWTLLTDFAITMPVEHLIYWLQVGVFPCTVRFHSPRNVNRSLIGFNKDAVEDLAQAKPLQHLADLRVKPLTSRVLMANANFVLQVPSSCRFWYHPSHSILIPLFLVIVLFYCLYLFFS